jgi:glycosyltransferase involved in cell wall biosynthesis
MNIAVVVHRFAPAIGGSERYAEVLTENLHDAGHEVTVYTTRHPDRDSDAFPYQIREFRNAVPEAFGYFAWPGLFTPTALRDLRAHDAIHAVPANMFSAVVGPMGNRLFDASMVLTTFYHPARMQTHRRLKRAYDRTILQRVLEQYDSLLVSSDFEFNELKRDFDLTNCRATRMDIPPTLDVTPAGEFRAQHGLEDGFVLLFVGRLDSHKGMSTLLPAVEYLSDEMPALRCVVVGETERWHDWPEDVTEAVEQHRERFRFTGTLTGQDLAAAYAAADVLVFPSEYETYGLVTVEALRYGTPVVATDVGIAPELITPEENGYLFDGTATDLATKVRKAERMDHDRIQERARASIDHLSWDETIAELEVLYRS